MLFFLFSFLFLFFGRTARHAELPWPGMEPAPPAVEAQNLNHWTTREVQHAVLSNRASNLRYEETCSCFLKEEYRVAVIRHS